MRFQKFQIKVTMLSVAVGFCLIWSLLFPLSLYANQIQTYATSVIDEQNVLDHAVRKRIMQTLEESALKRNIHVKVFILNQPSQEPIAKTAYEAVVQWEKNHFEMQKKKFRAYLVVNTVTNQSEIILGTQVPNDFGLTQGIRHIKEDILMPSLEVNDINKAVWESAVALSMILEDWPRTFTLAQKVKIWLANHHLTFLPDCLKWSFYLAIFIGLGLALKWYFRSPYDQDVNIASMENSLEAAIRCSEIAYWRESQQRGTELETS